MIKAEDKNIYRVVDANYNRLKEGLRVCEDTSRFILNDPSATRTFKNLRHQSTKALGGLKYKQLIASRDIVGDVGRASKKSELSRNKVADIFYANAQRSKESIRVLEEFTKLLNKSTALKLKRIRYKFYEVEKRIIKKL